jgi:hypothetical protein
MGMLRTVKWAMSSADARLEPDPQLRELIDL